MKQSSQPDISGNIRDLLSKPSGLGPNEISDNSDLVDIGIDSLMGMELAREIEIAFKYNLETSELVELADFQSLVKCVQKTLGLTDDDASVEVEEGGEDEEEIKHSRRIQRRGRDLASEWRCSLCQWLFIPRERRLSIYFERNWSTSGDNP